MPTGYIVSNESNYLASNFAIQSTSIRIQSLESSYLDSNIGIQSTLSNIRFVENSYLDSNVGIQSTAAVYPLEFTYQGADVQMWVS